MDEQASAAQATGIEAKILKVVSILKQHHSFAKYELAFHLDRYQGDAFYDRVLESIEDVGGFRVRFVDKSSVDIPIEALHDCDRSDFYEKWGEKIMATKR